MAWRTRWRVDSLTTPTPFSTRETEATDTSAWRATSRIVAGFMPPVRTLKAGAGWVANDPSLSR
jgi:hypothetical protein